MAGRLGAAPSRLSFGDSVAQAGAQPMWKIVNRKSEIANGLVRLPGIAPGHAPWREAILLLNHNRTRIAPTDVRRRGEEQMLHPVTSVATKKLKDRKSTRLNSINVLISYAVFYLKKKNTITT